MQQWEAFTQALKEITDEYNRAYGLHPPFNSAHEGYAVLLGEVRKLEREVFMRPNLRNAEGLRREAMQIAAMALRFMVDCCGNN